MLGARLVALATLRFRVFAKQGKVGELMVERVFVELHDVRIAAFMVGMAGCAAGVARVSVQAVKSGSGGYIGGNVFVTIEAQCALLGAFEFRVAGIAVLFVLRMTFDDLAGHDQRFDLGIGLLGCHEQECHRGPGQ